MIEKDIEKLASDLDAVNSSYLILHGNSDGGTSRLSSVKNNLLEISVNAILKDNATKGLFFNAVLNALEYGNDLDYIDFANNLNEVIKKRTAKTLLN